MTIENVFYLLSIVGMGFLVWKSISGPQQKSEKEDLALSLQLKQLQQDFANLRDNHVHTLDTKIDATKESVNALAIEVAKLSTTIEERIPRRSKK